MGGGGDGAATIVAMDMTLDTRLTATPRVSERMSVKPTPDTRPVRSRSLKSDAGVNVTTKSIGGTAAMLSTPGKRCSNASSTASASSN